MLRSLKLTISILICGASLSCQTIEIVNDADGIDQVSTEDWTWNHTGIFGLVNYSEDVRMKDKCPKEWATVTTGLNHGPLGAEVAMTIGQQITAISSPAALVSFFWSPLAVSWTCSIEN